MHPILFKIGPLSMHSYGFMLALAFLAGILISIHYAKKSSVDGQIILDLAIYLIIAGLFGARLFYVIGQWSYYESNPLEIIMIQKGGLVVLGGLAFSLPVVLWYAKRKNIPRLKLLDIISPGIALGYSIARIGCFLNGCCFGKPTDLPWGLVYSDFSVAGSYYPGIALHPTQLYAMISMFMVFVILTILWKNRKYDGQIFYWLLILYSVYRFLVEFLRYCPSQYYWFGLTPSQCMVLFLFVFGIFGLASKNTKLLQWR